MGRQKQSGGQNQISSSKSSALYSPDSLLRQIHPPPRKRPRAENTNYEFSGGTHFLGGGEMFARGDSGSTQNLNWRSIWTELQSGRVWNLHAHGNWRGVKSAAGWNLRQGEI